VNESSVVDDHRTQRFDEAMKDRSISSCVGGIRRYGGIVRGKTQPLDGPTQVWVGSLEVAGARRWQRRFMKKSKLLWWLPALLVCVLSPATFAGTILYSTSGSFFGGTGATVGDTQLTFTGLTNASLTTNLASAIINLGAFALVTPNGTPDTINTNFALTITEILPPSVPSSDTRNATVTGEVVFHDGVLTINFAPIVSTMVFTTGYGPITYTPDINTLIADTTSPTSLRGVVTGVQNAPLVPLPPAALAGVGLLSIVGAKKLRRGRDTDLT